jgi:hypothetical protein
MSIGEGWAQGARQGEKSGGDIFIGFRIRWFFARVTWWLGKFLMWDSPILDAQSVDSSEGQLISSAAGA